MKKLIGVLALFLCSFSTYAQNKEVVEISFEQGSSKIDKTYSINDKALNNLATMLKEYLSNEAIKINKIKIDSYASPEGGLALNDSLSYYRAKAVCDYINSLGLNIPSSIMEISSNGVAWEALKEQVSNSDMLYKEQVIKIIDEVPEETWAKTAKSRWLTLVDSRNKRLMDLKYGNPYRYMMEHIFPSLRKGSIVTLYLEQKPEPKKEVEVIEEPKEEEPVVEEPKEEEPVVAEPEKFITKPLFAIKTNLLYDAITALNVEVEVPIGKRWSVAAEWIFPWWTSCGNRWNDWQKTTNRNSLQMLNGNLEAKYWFGDRDNRAVMTGWNMGLNGGTGMYDLERKTGGYQGEFYTVGLSGGYAHTINKKGNLRLEYSISAGYMQTDYKHYSEHQEESNGEWHTITQETGIQRWVGPTKAKVSLVWLLNHKVKVK